MRTVKISPTMANVTDYETNGHLWLEFIELYLNRKLVRNRFTNIIPYRTGYMFKLYTPIGAPIYGIEVFNYCNNKYLNLK